MESGRLVLFKQVEQQKKNKIKSQNKRKSVNKKNGKRCKELKVLVSSFVPLCVFVFYAFLYQLVSGLFINFTVGKILCSFS